ncbi:MAG: hypothetical protein MI923_18815 [Phycisphaerales bacterium]|nr:hypothetical protein [Phycisphaerales bacterium]
MSPFERSTCPRLRLGHATHRKSAARKFWQNVVTGSAQIQSGWKGKPVADVFRRLRRARRQ